MQEKINLLDFLPEELVGLLGLPAWRVRQLMQWIYQKYARDFSQMSDLPKALREELGGGFHFEPLECVKSQTSQDGSIKYLFALRDGLRIESVLLPMKKELREQTAGQGSGRAGEEADEERGREGQGRILRQGKFTICVSSQVGCRSGCVFCLTAKGGLKRNLSPGEILAQVLWIKRANHIPYEQRVNVVFMGMGEPLDNLAKVAKAVKIMAHNDTLAIAPRRQTISTSGLASQIIELGKMDLGVLLAISLHAVNDELRSQLMPINKAYKIADIMAALRDFPINARKKLLFEYLLMAGVNDAPSHALELVRLLSGLRAKVNLILFNPHEGSAFRRPSLEDAMNFQALLRARGLVCTIRESKGLDISAACGQLRERSANSS